MKIRKTYIAILMLVLLHGFPANANLVEVDYLVAGDKLLTLDTETNLEWLDLTQTIGLSYNEVVAGAGGYTTTGGFRYASTEEVGTFFTNAGLLINQGWLEGVENAQALQNMIGSIDQGSAGFTADPSPIIAGHQVTSNLGIHDFNGTNKYAVIAALTLSAAADVGHISTGSWLVRPAAVPEPTSAILVITGSMTLLLCRNRKNRTTSG